MRGDSDKLDSYFAFVFSSHWQNNVYPLSHPYVFMTKIHYCFAITVLQPLFHTELSELSSENCGFFEKKSILKEYR